MAPMAENSLVAAASKKPLAYAIAEEHDMDLLEIELRQYEDSLTSAQAKELLREVCWWYLHRIENEKGLLHLPREAQKAILAEFDWLFAITGLKHLHPATIEKYAKKVADRKWDETFEGRTKYAALRFRDRMLQVDRLMPIVETAILKGDLGAVDKFVALARLDMDAVGYKAPAKYEFSAGIGDELTEADKKKASEAIEDARKFEEELLGSGGTTEIVEGQFEDTTEEE